MGCSKSSLPYDSNIVTQKNKIIDNKKTNENGNAKKDEKHSQNGGGSATQLQPNQIINPYVPFTNKDVFHLKASWKGIRRSMEETGVLMFVNKFMNLGSDELSNSTILSSHASTVMAEIDKTISDIDKADASHARLRKLGIDHKNRGIKDFFFWEIREPFLLSVEAILGDRYTEHMRKIYEAFIEYLVKTLMEGFNS